MPVIRIELVADRDRCGACTLVDDKGGVILGPVPVSGRSSDKIAGLRNNKRRVPLFLFGDTPTGFYRVGRVEMNELRYPAREFGSRGVIILIPTSGDAACADANGRYCIALFGGPLSADGSLRSTAGGLRMHDDDVAAIVEATASASKIRCEIVEVLSLADYGTVFDDCDCQHDDPFMSPEFEPVVSETTLSSNSWAAGAFALGMTVTFAASATPMHAPGGGQVTKAADSIGALLSERNVQFVQLDAQNPGYVRLAYNSDTPSVELPASQAQSDIVTTETQSALQGEPPPEPQTYSEELVKIRDEVIKEIPKETALKTVEILQDTADKMADSSEAAEWKPAVSILDEADTEFSISKYSVASQTLEAVGNAFKLKSAFDSGTRIGNAINDLQAGKIDVATFTQRVGPEPAKILLAYSGLPFSDRVVDFGVATLNKGASSAIDFGFEMYDKYKGYQIEPPKGEKK